MTIPTQPNALLDWLERAETDSKRAPDHRRELRAEREALHVAIQSSDAARIKAARDEALRVARMWEGAA